MSHSAYFDEAVEKAEDQHVELFPKDTLKESTSTDICSRLNKQLSSDLRVGYFKIYHSGRTNIQSIYSSNLSAVDYQSYNRNQGTDFISEQIYRSGRTNIPSIYSSNLSAVDYSYQLSNLEAKSKIRAQSIDFILERQKEM